MLMDVQEFKDLVNKTIKDKMYGDTYIMISTPSGERYYAEINKITIGHNGGDSKDPYVQVIIHATRDDFKVV